MANKPLDDIGEPGKMLKALAQAEREQQEKDPAALDSPRVIITPDPEPCVWCVVEPASPRFYPYCSIDCAVASAVDDERERHE